MTMNTQADQLFGDDVCTPDGDTIGTVDTVWVDDATNQTEFIGVTTGWLFGKTHVIPTAAARVAGTTITVPYGKEQIEGAPSFDTDAEISPEEEQQVYRYYGLDRSTSASPTGLAAGERATESGGTGTASFDRTDRSTPADEADLALSEEELTVGKRQVQAGDVQLRKVVRTEHQEVPVELRREDIEIERVPASEISQADTTGQAFQEQTIDVPLMEEEPVVEKQSRVTGGVRVSKDVETETQTVGGEVRSEDIEVDRNTSGGQSIASSDDR